MKKCIGIISYLPDDPELRKTRLKAFKKQIIKMDKTLNLPTLIVIQNYTEEDKKIFSKNCILFEYGKLGITKARKTIRKHLLESEYDMYILFDDDEIISSKKLAKNYLKFIDEHPDSYINYYLSYIRGCAVSRYILERCPFPNTNAQLLEGWDDAVYIFSIWKVFPDRCYEFKDTDFQLEIDESNIKYPSSWKESISLMCLKYIERNTLVIREQIKNDPNYKIPEEWFLDE